MKKAQLPKTAMRRSAGIRHKAVSYTHLDVYKRQDLDKAVRKHELVAVETGKNIDDVADALIRAVRDDLAEMPEYAHCETAAYAPEPVQEHRRVRRYQYEMMGIVYPQYAEKNILIDYGVIEEAE